MRAVEAGRPLGEVLDSRQKWLLLASLMVAMFIGAIDQTVVTTAMPHILADLGGFELLSWTFTSYMLTSTIVVPLVGKLSDIYGRKFFVIGGIVLFLMASVACGASPNMEALIGFRALQGFGGGMIFASVFTSIGDIFPPADRSKYVGMFTGVFSLASILGPTLGGFLTDNGGWRWVFYINVPFCLIAIPAIWWNLPARHGVTRPKIDWIGAGLLSLAAVMLLLAFEWAGNDYAWASWQIIGLLAGAAVVVAAFAFQERRHPEPILPLFLFRNRIFLVCNVLVFILGMGMFGALQYLALFVQTAMGKSATASGIISTPQSLGLLATSIIGGQVIARTGRYKWQTIIGAVFILVAMLFLRTLQVDTPEWHISAYMVILGLGFGLVMPTLTLSIQNALPYQYLGVASSSSQFFRQIGSVFGIAIFAAVLTSSYEASFADELPPAAQQQLGPALMQSFQDPTLPINTGVFAGVQQNIRTLPGGEQLLDEAVAAQKESVAVAVQDIFLGATIVAAIGLALCFLLKEVPLRRDFKTPTSEDETVDILEPNPEPATASAPAPAGGT